MKNQLVISYFPQKRDQRVPTSAAAAAAAALAVPTGCECNLVLSMLFKFSSSQLNALSCQREGRR